MNYDNEILWNKKYRNKKYFLKYPDEIVVKFVAKYITSHNCKVLDLGCGSGRHSEFLAYQGFHVYGCDLSKNSIEISKNRLTKKELSASFEVAKSWKLPYKSNFFDYVIAWHSIYYNNYKNMVESINEIHRVLRKNGMLLISFLAPLDFRKIYGKTRDKKTYVGTKDTYDHNNITYCVLQLSQIKKLFHKRLKIIADGYHEMYFDKKQRICHFVLIAKKVSK